MILRLHQRTDSAALPAPGPQPQQEQLGNGSHHNGSVLSEATSLATPGSSPMRRVPSHALMDFGRDVLVPEQVSFGEGSADMQFSFGSHSLQGQRDKMEDRVILQDLSAASVMQPCHRAVFLAVLDGHAGSAAVDLLAQRLLPALLQTPGLRGAPLEALRNAVMVCEEELMAMQCLSGSTALLVLLVDSDLYLANVGDSRAVVCDDGEARQLTADHKPYTNEMERTRLLQAGAKLSADDYVQLKPAGCECSDLGVSRALGGAHLKAIAPTVPPALSDDSGGDGGTSLLVAAAARRTRSGGNRSDGGGTPQPGEAVAGGGGSSSSSAAAATAATSAVVGVFAGFLAGGVLPVGATVGGANGAALVNGGPLSPRQPSVSAGQPTRLPPRNSGGGGSSPRPSGPLSPSTRQAAAPNNLWSPGGVGRAASLSAGRLAPPPTTPPASPAGFSSAAAALAAAAAIVQASGQSPAAAVGGVAGYSAFAVVAAGGSSSGLPSTHSSASSLSDSLQGGGRNGPAASLVAVTALSSGVVIPDPDLFHYAVTQDSEFLILACDGLWDAVRNGESTRKVRRWLADGHSAAEAARLLSDSAIKLGSTDNVTTIVLRFSSRAPISIGSGNSMLMRRAGSTLFGVAQSDAPPPPAPPVG